MPWHYRQVRIRKKARETGYGMKRLTIVTTTYISGKYLPGYFEGMLRLNHLEQLQVILVQNQPDKYERQIADEYQRHNPGLLHVIQLDHRETIGASTNRGFALADTPYLAYQDVDDVRVPDSFERQMATLDSYPEVDFTYGDFIRVNAQGVKEGWYASRPEFDHSSFTRYCFAGPTHLFRIGLLEKVGGWDEQFLSGGDFDFQVRAALNCEFKKTPGLLLYYTKYQDSGSASSSMLEPIERTVIELRYGAFDIIDYRYLKYAGNYRINEMLFNGDWHPLNNYVPNYTELIKEREHLRAVGVRNFRIAQIKRLPASVKQAIKSSLRFLLVKLGLYDRLIPYWRQKRK